MQEQDKECIFFEELCTSCEACKRIGEPIEIWLDDMELDSD